MAINNLGNTFSYTYYNYAALTNRVKTLKSDIDLANYQITTGKRAPTFTEQPMAATFVSLKSTIAQQTQYISNATTAQIRLKIVDTVLSGIETTANEARKAAEVTQYNPEQYAFLSNYVRNGFDQVVDNLNSQDDNGYIFGGLSTDRLPVQFGVDSNDSSWSKLPANKVATTSPAPIADWGSQALSISQAANDASTAVGASPASVVAALPANTPSDIVQAAQAAAAAGGATPATVAAAIDTAIGVNVGADVYPNGTATALPGNYFSTWEDTSTVPSTFNFLTGANQTASRPEYTDYYYAGGPGVNSRNGANVDGLKIQIDDNSTVDMGFSAEESAMEKILRGLNLLSQIPAPADPENPTDNEKAAYLAYAQAGAALLRQGGNELDNIRLRASSAMTTVTDKVAQLTSLRNTTQNAVDPLENVDQATAIATLQTLQNSLNASYSVISQLQNNTILNYL